MNDPVAILVIDDDIDFLTSMVALLQPLGYHVATARNGAEGWARLETDRPDVLLMDWILPDTDGVALIRRMRASAEHRERYIIMVTGRSGKEDLIRGMDEGANDYLPKPFYNEELLVRIRVGIRTKRLEEDLAAQVRRMTVLEMAGSLAHEIGNPLSAIKLLLGKLLRDERLAGLPDIMRDLKALDKELDRIESLVRKAQHINLVQSKPYAGNLQIIDLNSGGPAEPAP
jgi:two-component system, NtrC family, sensor kinase